MKRPKALALLSGGLDSTLAARLLVEQGIEVEAINFVSPFCLCKTGGCGAPEIAKQLGIPLKVVSVGTDYLKVVRRPKHGYGKNMNPCVDCRIFMLKEAKKYARDIGASFIFTGEVLDERPMSQHLRAMKTIEEEAGLRGRILRPLSAKLLSPTRAEKEGIVDRKRLLDIRGRSRKAQIELAKKFEITDYPCPAGGCLLTYREFANKVRDLFNHRKRVSLKDIALLKVGRHLRDGKNKIVVGRNEAENRILLQMKTKSDYWFEVPDTGSPITILQGPKTRRAIGKAAALTAYYSDKRGGNVHVKYGRDSLNRSVIVLTPDREEIEKMRIT